MAKRIILGVQVTDRLQKVVDMQKILMEYGCYIRTRLRVPDVDQTFCSPTGLVVLETFGDEAMISAME